MEEIKSLVETGIPVTIYVRRTDGRLVYRYKHTELFTCKPENRAVAENRFLDMVGIEYHELITLDNDNEYPCWMCRCSAEMRILVDPTN